MVKTNSTVLACAFSIMMISSSFAQSKTVLARDIDLSVKEAGSQVVLAWSVPGDSSCTYCIERSSNGVHFEVIWSVKGKIDCSTCRYSFADKKPVNGNNYYRIRQTDSTGKTNYSKTLTEAFTASIKPFKISTAGKRISIQCTQSMQRILAWTSTGNRMVDKDNFNNNNFSFSVPGNDRIIFVMMELKDGSRYTEKIGLE